MHAIKAIYDGVNFKPMQPVPVNEDYVVVITFIEPVKGNTVRPPFEYGSIAEGLWMSDDFDDPLDDFLEYME